jgi:Na+/phosphate symporter
MIIVLSSLVICIVGLIMYALATNAKVVEIGRIMFAFGLLAFLLAGGPSLTIMHH